MTYESGDLVLIKPPAYAGVVWKVRIGIYIRQSQKPPWQPYFATFHHVMVGGRCRRFRDDDIQKVT